MKNGLATQFKYSKILTIISTLTILFINHVIEIYQWFGLLLYGEGLEFNSPEFQQYNVRIIFILFFN
jgi:hypothetical protein